VLFGFVGDKVGGKIALACVTRVVCVGYDGALGVRAFIGGRIVDITGGYSRAFELGSAFALGAAIVALFLPQARFKRGTINREGAIRRSDEYLTVS
jgi:hypothetical protein